MKVFLKNLVVSVVSGTKEKFSTQFLMKSPLNLEEKPVSLSDTLEIGTRCLDTISLRYKFAIVSEEYAFRMGRKCVLKLID